MLNIVTKEHLGQVIPPYDLLWRGIDLAKEIGDSGIKITIPRIFLHGTQRREEYDNRKRKQLEAELDKEGKEYLLKNPIIVCAIYQGNQVTLAVIDGHHRMRFSGGKYGVKEIPSLVCTPAALVEIINNHSNEKTDEQSFINSLFNQIAEAAYSFEQFDTYYTPSLSISNVSDVNQLQERLKSF